MGSQASGCRAEVGGWGYKRETFPGLILGCACVYAHAHARMCVLVEATAPMNSGGRRLSPKFVPLQTKGTESKSVSHSQKLTAGSGSRQKLLTSPEPSSKSAQL